MVDELILLGLGADPAPFIPLLTLAPLLLPLIPVTGGRVVERMEDLTGTEEGT